MELNRKKHKYDLSRVTADDLVNSTTACLYLLERLNVKTADLRYMDMKARRLFGRSVRTSYVVPFVIKHWSVKKEEI